jgi:hypothetical protein
MVYECAETKGMSSVHFTELPQRERMKNNRVQLTRLLSYSDDVFFQVLEGGPDSVEIDEMYKKLHLDESRDQLTFSV